jgi:Rad3-related DNA helicase
MQAEHYIHKTKVLFPFAVPYPQQFALMSMTIKALTEEKNALLESPTGKKALLALHIPSLFS